MAIGAQLQRRALHIMPGIRSIIEESLRRKVESELGASVWTSMLTALDEQPNDPQEPLSDLVRLQRTSALAAERFRCDRAALLLELGLAWWGKVRQTASTNDPRPVRVRALTAALRSDQALTDLGFAPLPQSPGYPVHAIILQHTQPVAGCRSFVFGVLYGVGRAHRIPVDVLLLEPHELNGHADILGVMIG